MSNRELWERADNLLCVRLDALGDVVMTTPALRALKHAKPGRQLTLLTAPAGAAAAPLVPEIDSVIVYEAPWMKATALREDCRPEFEMIERLRSAHFDAVVVFTVYSQNPLPAALVCYLAEIPLRLAHCHENPYQLLTDWVPDPEPHQLVRHEVRRQLDLVAAIGASIDDERLSICVPPAARWQVRDRLRAMGLSGDSPWVLIHPGASAPSRRYPPDAFAETARRLATEHGLPVVFTGTQAEHELVESVRATMAAPSHALDGTLDLGELAALIELAPVLIANNTGPVHLAAALGTPVVDLYALTNPQHTPWQVPHRVLFHDVPCKFCYKSVCLAGHHECLRLVPPSAVIEAALQLLRSGKQGSAGGVGTVKIGSPVEFSWPAAADSRPPMRA